MLDANEMKVLQKMVGEQKGTQNKKPTNQRILRIQTSNEWVERREWVQHVTSRDNIPLGRRSQGCPKRRRSDLIMD